MKREQTSWENLATLDLSCNNFGEQGAIKLSGNTTWTNLITLILSVNKIGDQGATTLSKNTSWINLKTPQLSQNNKLCRKKYYTLQFLRLTNFSSFPNLFGKAVFLWGSRSDIVKQEYLMDKITTLDFSRNKIGAEGADALSKNTSWTSLTTLDLWQNNIGDEGSTALSKNTS